MELVGRHLVVDAYDCSPDVLNDADLLERMLIAAVEATGDTVLHSYFHRFQPQGVTGALVIASSHMTIHTWPERQYVAFDLFTCGGGNARAAVEQVIAGLGARHSTVTELVRGHDPGPLAPATLPPSAAVRADWWDQAELRCILSRPHRVLHQADSAFQNVLVVEARDIRMYLDQQLQFSAWDERHYHEALVHPPLTLAPARERVLILGGGDGLAMREVLKYPEVLQVDLVDIDPVVVAAARDIPAMADLNGGALRDPRARVHVQDAVRFVARRRRPYHVIIMDFPDPADAAISRLYSMEFFQKTARLLAPDGIIVCQSHSPEDAPLVYWTIGRTMEAAGLRVLSYHMRLPSFGDWGFYLAALHPLAWQGARVAVPHETMPDDPSEWFAFAERLAAPRAQAGVNSLDHLILHDLYGAAVGPG